MVPVAAVSGVRECDVFLLVIANQVVAAFRTGEFLRRLATQAANAQERGSLRELEVRALRALESHHRRLTFRAERLRPVRCSLQDSVPARRVEVRSSLELGAACHSPRGAPARKRAGDRQADQKQNDEDRVPAESAKTRRTPSGQTIAPTKAATMNTATVAGCTAPGFFSRERTPKATTPNTSTPDTKPIAGRSMNFVAPNVPS